MDPIHDAEVDAVEEESNFTRTRIVGDDNEDPEALLKGSRISSANTMVDDLKKLALSDELMIAAIEIHNELKIPSKRNGRRKKVLFLCVFYAHIKLDLTPNPKLIAQMIGLNPSDVKKSFSMLQESQTQFRPASRYYKPVDFIDELCDELHVVVTSRDPIKKMCDDIYNKNTQINQSFPQVIAGGVMMLYLDIHGIKYDAKLLADAVGKSETTLNAARKKVETVYNS